MQPSWDGRQRPPEDVGGGPVFAQDTGFLQTLDENAENMVRLLDEGRKALEDRMTEEFARFRDDQKGLREDVSARFSFLKERFTVVVKETVENAETLAIVKRDSEAAIHELAEVLDSKNFFTNQILEVGVSAYSRPFLLTVT